MKKLQKGFSLIEVLVGIAIIITATTVVLSLIISTFRISNKTTTESVIRQNGNYSINQVTRMIQFADGFLGRRTSGGFNVLCNTVTESVTELHIKYQDSNIIIACGSTGVTIAGESSIDTKKVDVVSCNLTCTQNAADPPLIGIEFQLDSAGGNNVAERNSSQTFSTTVQMRN